MTPIASSTPAQTAGPDAATATSPALRAGLVADRPSDAHRHLTHPITRTIMFIRPAILSLLLLAPAAQAQDLLNVSYDPTRELYRDVNQAFAAHWQAQGHDAPTIETSHGGSGAQARSVIDGLNAQVVTLALASDIDQIAAAGKLPVDWQ